jgi:hypothetical protein
MNVRRPAFIAALTGCLLLITACSSSNNNAGNVSTALPSASGSAKAGAGATIDAIPCEANEQLTYHVHAHLAIFADSNPVPIPANIGIILPKCFYWLHTHDTTGIIHMEAPAERSFTLGNFFDIWGQPLDATHAAAYTAAGSNSLMFYLDGKQYAGDPRQISLVNHTMIVIEWGQKFLQPPLYQFPAGY